MQILGKICKCSSENQAQTAKLPAKVRNRLQNYLQISHSDCHSAKNSGPVKIRFSTDSNSGQAACCCTDELY